MPGALCPGAAKHWRGVFEEMARGIGVLARFRPWRARPARHEVSQGNRLLLLRFELVSLVKGAAEGFQFVCLVVTCAAASRYSATFKLVNPCKSTSDLRPFQV